MVWLHGSERSTRTIEKVWFLTYFAALSAISPYLPLYSRRLGLTEQQIGVVGALRPWVSFPTASVWSGLADRHRSHRAIFVGNFAMAALLRLSLAAVGGFGWLLAAVLVTEFFAGAVTILADAAVQASCTEEGSYGRQRLFGAVGWGIFAAVTGVVVSHTSIYSIFVLHALLSLIAAVPTAQLDFRPLLSKLGGPAAAAAPGSGGTLLKKRTSEIITLDDACDACGAASPELPSDAEEGGQPTPERQQRQQPAEAAAALAQPPVRFWRGIAQLLSGPDALVFFAQSLVLGYGVGNIETYLFLYLDRLHGSATLMGLSLTVTCLAEGVVFYFSGEIIRGLGVQKCLHAVFAAFLVRLGCYTMLASWGNPWLVLPVEVLHGLTFALAWAAGTAYSAQIAPPGLEATAQSLFQGLYFGVGFGVGGLVGGRVFESHGGPAVYASAFAVVASGWLVTSLMQLALPLVRRRQQYSQVPMTELVAGGTG